MGGRQSYREDNPAGEAIGAALPKNGARPQPMGRSRLRRPGRRIGSSQREFAHINLCDKPLGNDVIGSDMPYANFLEELRKTGLSVREFAELIGMNPNSVSNYARTGELPTHLALIAVLVVGISEMGGDYRRIMSRVERVRKKPRGSASQGRFGGWRQGKASA